MCRNIYNAVKYYNIHTGNKHNININDVYYNVFDIHKQHTQYYNEFRDIKRNDEMANIIIRFEQMMSDNYLKERDDQLMQIDNEVIDRNDWIGQTNKRFTMRRLCYGLDSFLYHQEFNNGNILCKTLMIARRSNKCTAFLNHYYGRVYKIENVFENTQLNTLWRIMFGIPLTDQNHNITCTGCNMLLDHTRAYIHVFECRFGRAHHY